MRNTYCLGLKILLVKQDIEHFLIFLVVHLLLEIRSIAPSKLPKLPQKVVQTKPVRLSMSRSSSKASSST